MYVYILTYSIEVLSDTDSWFLGWAWISPQPVMFINI